MTSQIIVARNDVETIAKVESLGTWIEERFMFDSHNSFDIWRFNGQYYRIYKDSERFDNE